MRFEQCANPWNGEWDGHIDLKLSSAPSLLHLPDSVLLHGGDTVEWTRTEARVARAGRQFTARVWLNDICAVRLTAPG